MRSYKKQFGNLNKIHIAQITDSQYSVYVQIDDPGTHKRVNGIFHK